MVLGATGTIGQATVRALVSAGHEAVAFVRSTPATTGQSTLPTSDAFTGATVRFGSVTEPEALLRDGFQGEPFDAVISCLASRTGQKADAWAVDHDANVYALQAATDAGVPQFVLLSAICVQKPVLHFQKAKLAFEDKLKASGLTYTIVRPTAYFKSLSGQIDRLRRGKSYLLIGDGRLTACTPISDGDLARYLVDCLDNPERRNAILPIGGPGPAITPRDQGEELFRLMGQQPRFTHLPVAVLDGIVTGLSAAGLVLPAAARKADLARIGRYYATESMLVLNPHTGRYDRAATPSFGTQTLFDHYRRCVDGEVADDRGDHAVF